MTLLTTELEGTAAYENLISFRDKLITSMIENIDGSDLDKAFESKIPSRKGRSLVIRNFISQLKEFFRVKFEAN